MASTLIENHISPDRAKAAAVAAAVDWLPLLVALFTSSVFDGD
jgi:hypothetical protein